MPDKKTTEDEPLRSMETDTPNEGNREAEDRSKTTEEWFAGVGAGLKGASQKLLDQVPPELRGKIIAQARTHGPGSAAVAVEGAALKARGLKTKLALKALAKLLRLLDSQKPSK